MAQIDLKVPSPGESITEVTIARLVRANDETVDKDEVLAEIDSDKATLTLNAEDAGKLTWLCAEGETVKVGQVIATIDTSVKPQASVKPAPVTTTAKSEPKTEPKAAPAPPPAPPTPSHYANGSASPAAAKLMAENNISPQQIKGSGKDGRITKHDIILALAQGFETAQNAATNTWKGSRDTDRQKMSSLRKTLARRLVSVKNETAMLTTFNEVDMSAIYAIRAKYKEQFKETHGASLGFMSFFTKAVTEALFHFPAVNAMIQGDDIIYHKYCDIAIAVSAPKGLMVPVIRNAEQMHLAEIESAIKTLAIKARDGKLTIPEMEGGTFTITNGGVFGSMMSTPIINPPQSAILGMHNVVERPVAVNGQVVIRPMMYVALSYDHRIIDGRESVGFLVKVKEMLENPTSMLFGGKSPEALLLNL